MSEDEEPVIGSSQRLAALPDLPTLQELGVPGFTAVTWLMVVFPAGVPHRNWNAGSEPTVHLAINVPQPDPSAPFATTVAT